MFLVLIYFKLNKKPNKLNHKDILKTQRRKLKTQN